MTRRTAVAVVVAAVALGVTVGALAVRGSTSTTEIHTVDQVVDSTTAAPSTSADVTTSAPAAFAPVTAAPTTEAPATTAVPPSSAPRATTSTTAARSGPPAGMVNPHPCGNGWCGDAPPTSVAGVPTTISN